MKVRLLLTTIYVASMWSHTSMLTLVLNTLWIHIFPQSKVPPCTQQQMLLVAPFVRQKLPFLCRRWSSSSLARVCPLMTVYTVSHLLPVLFCAVFSTFWVCENNFKILKIVLKNFIWKSSNELNLYNPFLNMWLQAIGLSILPISARSLLWM